MIEIPPNTNKRLYPPTNDKKYHFVPTINYGFTGCFFRVESDGSLTVRNNSTSPFYISIVRGS